MKDITHYELFTVLLGSGRAARAVARRLHIKSMGRVMLICEKRPLLPFTSGTPSMCRIPADASDVLLMEALRSIETESETALPLLVICDKRYSGFAARCREELEQRFVVRDAAALLEVGHEA